METGMIWIPLACLTKIILDGRSPRLVDSLRQEEDGWRFAYGSHKAVDVAHLVTHGGIGIGFNNMAFSDL